MRENGNLWAEKRKGARACQVILFPWLPYKASRVDKEQSVNLKQSMVLQLDRVKHSSILAKQKRDFTAL